MSGNLFQIKLSDLGPTLTVLSGAGVSMEDFNDVRRYPRFRDEVVRLFTERRAKIDMALGDDEGLALLAIKELDDPKLLRDIIDNALLVSACRAAIKKIPSYEAYHVARTHPHMEVVKAALVCTDDRNLWVLLSSSACAGMRHQLAQAEYRRRFGKDSPFSG
jgi:hypothetical protein